MKLHDLRPAEGSHKARTRVGRGIAAGKGKTAGRGTKGQKARTGHGALPAWFEGGQTPIHVRLPKLRGFKNRFRIEYEIVNVGRLSALAETGILDAPETDGAPSASAKAAKAAKAAKPAPVTITPDILAVVGLVRTLDKPLKVLGHGDVTRPLFVVADAFSKSAIAKIEAAGGTAQVLDFPTADKLEFDEAPAPEGLESPAAPSQKQKPLKPAPTAETLPPTSSADEAGPEA